MRSRLARCEDELGIDTSPDNAECNMFHGEFDPEEKIADTRQDPDRLFGPDGITDKEIRLLTGTLKERPNCCRTDQRWDTMEDAAEPLLVFLVNACAECMCW